jgi:DNA-binding transcriptional LysR family regulator
MGTITERNLSGVDLNLLVVFDALMAERHVTRAALRNGLSQPAVSKALNRLRYLFDDPLFVRKDRRMEPTPRAIELSGPIHEALENISRTLTRPMAFNPGEIAARVTLATIDSLQTTLLPLLIAKVRKEAPGLDLNIKAMSRSLLYAGLASGELDLAIGPAGSERESIRSMPLWKDRLVTLVAAHNPVAEELTLETFAAAAHAVDAGHVQINADGKVSSVVDAILAASGLKRRIKAVLPTSAALPFVVAATDLIATLPSRVVQELQLPENVLVIPAPFPGIEVSPHLLWHARTEGEPLHSWLRSAIGGVAQALKIKLL